MAKKKFLDSDGLAYLKQLLESIYAKAGHTHDDTYVKKSGDTISGNLTVTGNTTSGKFIGTLDGNATSATSATTATKLATARKLKVSLNSGASVSFDGTGDKEDIGVSGTLPIANGGTGATTESEALDNLGAMPLAIDTSDGTQYLLGKDANGIYLANYVTGGV